MIDEPAATTWLLAAMTKEGEYYRLAESEDDESGMEGSRKYIRALYQVALNLEIGDSDIWEAKSKAELGQDFDMGELGGEA